MAFPFAKKVQSGLNLQYIAHITHLEFLKLWFFYWLCSNRIFPWMQAGNCRHFSLSVDVQAEMKKYAINKLFMHFFSHSKLWLLCILYFSHKSHTFHFVNNFHSSISSRVAIIMIFFSMEVIAWRRHIIYRFALSASAAAWISLMIKMHCVHCAFDFKL